MPQGEIGEVVAALVGPDQVGLERGVGGDAPDRPAVRREREQRTLGVVQCLRPGRIGEPGTERGLVGRVELGRIQPGRLAVPGGDGQPGDLPSATPPAALHGEPGPGGAGRVRAEPAGELPRLDHRAVQVEPALGLGLDGLQRGVQAVPQDPELERVEDLVHLVPIPRHAGQIGHPQRQLHVTDELVELLVAQHVGQVRADGLAGLARDLVDLGHQLVERAVLEQPLRRRLRPHPRHAGQVVAGLADQRGEIAVEPRRDAVLGLDRGRRHPGQLGDAPHRVEHGAGVGDELEGIPIARADQRLDAGVAGLGGEGGDDVVGLEPLHLDVPDPQRGQHLLDQADLALEVGRRLGPTRLVLGVGLGAERPAGHVERHTQVGGLLVPQHVDQHRGEAVDGVRRLPGRGGEVLHGQSEERAVGQRMAIEQQKPGTRNSSGHETNSSLDP